ncbi:MAG: iron-containing alcohol dehydrogenase [Acidimicrobiales bacterium]|nr:iron-containing alcohol dehydrogenase [Acidimicrobiales bacterium]
MLGREWTHVGYAQRLLFGAGVGGTVAEVVKDVGARRVMLVTSEGRLSSEAGQALCDRLGRALVTTFAGVRPHVPTTAVQSAISQARAAGVDGVVSFGGGSCVDAAKAVCFFVEQQEGTPGTSYLDRPVLAHVAVPTTYSGAEVTPSFGVTDEAVGRKTSARGPTVAPVAVLYDPALTVDLPARASAESGMNCLAHGVECAWSPSRSPEAGAVALACITRVAEALPAVVADPSDLDARTAMLEAAALGGRCLHNASVGVAHGLSQLLGGRTGMPHGLANALILPHAMRFNLPVLGGEDAAAVGAILGDPEDPAAGCEALRARLGLPSGLSDCGVSEDDVEAVVRLSQSSPAVGGNPRPVSEADARAILEAAW